MNDSPAPGASTQNFGEHGMLMFGGVPPGDEAAPVFASHLPMFRVPHRFQVVMRVEGAPAKVLRTSVATHGEQGLATFQPELFSIDELDPAGGPVRTTIAGKLFAGHYERGGNEIARGELRVAATLMFRAFAEHTDPALARSLRYLAFGVPELVHLAHIITAPPDFDQILVARIPGLPPEFLTGALELLVPDRPNDVEHRLVAGDRVTVEAAGGLVEVFVVQELYLETGDLAEVE